MDMSSSVRYVKGVGDKKALLLGKLGIYTVADLISYYPRDYEDRGNVQPVAETELGQTASLILTVGTVPVYRLIRKGLSVTKFNAYDDSGVCNITFFNQPYAKDVYKTGTTFRFYGKIEGNMVRRELTNPASEQIKEGKELTDVLPIYSLTSGISQNFLRSIIRTAMEALYIPETLPDDMLERFTLMSRKDAVYHVHFPKDKSLLARAKARLAFDELLVFRLGMERLKSRAKKSTGIVIDRAAEYCKDFFSLLPFEPTGAQKRCVGDIADDLKSGVPMTRLIQGDVGSGKTAVAAAAIYAAVKGGYQAIMMAPTEILARQHYEYFKELFSGTGISVGLLISSMKASEKKSVIQACKSGELHLTVGTHAVIQSGVEFANAGLVIADEQHRFGVRQRASLSDKGKYLHTLIMSATPIPRTLALIVYGDLNVSVLDEMPPGRQHIDTYVVDESFRERINKFIRRLVEEGGQAYIVCPLVEDEEGESDLKDVKSFAKELSEKVFPDIPSAFIHGKMKSAEKDGVMSRFADGDVKILISTTVIEVGVNVPNAVVMVVENAERFGLSQLHQLRGRVGRGDKKSYCVLFSQGGGEKTKARLEIMAKTNDGFEIAKRDLELRGPGDFFGERQHGLTAFKLANIFEDTRLIAMTGEAIERINERDPELKSEFSSLLPEVKRLFTVGGSDNIFN